MPVELAVVESVTELETTVVTVVLESASAPGPAGPAGAGIASGGTAGQVLTKDSSTDFDATWHDPGAPADATYLVTTADSDLTAEVVVGATPGGELGGTWASPTVDASHSGSTHAAVQAAAEATAAAALAGHTGDTSDAHDASAISVDSTNLAGTGTDVQTVLEELDDAIAAVDAGDVPSTRTLTAGAGLAGGGDLSADRSFAVNVDDSSIEINVDTLRVKAGGITSAMIADGTVAVGDLAFDPATQAELDAHVNDTTDAHAGSAITNTAAGNISATTVQAAINELDTEKQPLDSDLTAIAGLSPTNDDIIQRKGGVWANRTIAQLLTDLGAAGTTFQPLDSDLTAIAALSTTAFGRGLLALANAAALATAAGLGTGDSPEFTAVNIGHASDTTLTRASAGNLAVEGNALYRAGGTDVALADGGTGASLTDPDADRIAFWDDSAGAFTWLAPDDSTVEISGTTFRVKDSGITSAKIADSTIVNGDISGSAAIAYSKLNLSASIVAGDISDAELAALAGLTSAANKVPRFTGSGTADLLDFNNWTDYTPTLTGSVSNPTLGSGSIAAGRWCRIGKIVIAKIRINFGTSGTAAGSGNYRISLPNSHTVSASAIRQAAGMGYIFDSSASDTFPIMADETGSGNGYVELWQAGTLTAGQVTAAAPFAWAASDEIHLVLFLDVT